MIHGCWALAVFAAFSLGSRKGGPAAGADGTGRTEGSRAAARPDGTESDNGMNRGHR